MRKKRDTFLIIPLVLAISVFLLIKANGDSVQDTILTRVVAWQVENVVLQNTVPITQAIFDDDPVYSLKANLLVTYVDGTQATLSWESWRYGLVLGPIVLSLGDGPPGYIVAATVQ